MAPRKDWFNDRVRVESRGEGAKKGKDTKFRRDRYKPGQQRLKCQELYQSAEWQTLREIVLAEESVCRICQARVAEHADHIIPHRGSRRLFYDRDNVWGLCVPCHIKKSRRGR